MEDWEEDDWSEGGWDDDDAAETIPCPECGEEVYEEAEQCPHCGQYVTHSSSGYVWKNRPQWWIVLGVLGIFAVIFVISGLLGFVGLF